MTQETDSTYPQRLQRCYDEISQRFHDNDVKIQTLALLIKDGILNDETWKQANQRAIAIYIKEDEAKKQRQAEQEEKQKQMDKPDSKIPILWQAVKVQPDRLTKYLETYDIKALEKYLSDMKARPLFYHSIYHGQVTQTITFMENALNQRRNQASEPKAPPRPPAPTATPFSYST